MGFWGPKTLLSAVELGVFAALAQGPLDAESLRARLGLHPRSARDFFDALVALGLLKRHDGLCANTPETDWFLDRAKPTYIGGYLELLNVRLYGFWGVLTEALRSGQPQNESKTGGDLFPALCRDPLRLQQFLQAMGCDFTGPDCRAWMKEVGFRDTYVEPLDGHDSMVVGIK